VAYVALVFHLIKGATFNPHDDIQD
jgi:hypothetical protein